MDSSKHRGLTPATNAGYNGFRLPIPPVRSPMTPTPVRCDWLAPSYAIRRRFPDIWRSWPSHISLRRAHRDARRDARAGGGDWGTFATHARAVIGRALAMIAASLAMLNDISGDVLAMFARVPHEFPRYSDARIRLEPAVSDVPMNNAVASLGGMALG